MPRPVTPSGNYRPGLDGIRAIAVAGVLAYHFDAPWLPGGLLGVGVFFTLSGFLITSILMSTWERRGDLNLKDFWLRRARRLMPALVLVVAAVVVATIAVAPSQLGARLRESFGAAFYVTNWADILGGNSYFDQLAGPDPFDHLWSLAVEEQFYLVWPLVLLALLNLRRGQYVRVGILTSGIAAISFVLMYWFTQPGFDHTRVYEGTDTRAGGVLVGAALAIFLHASKTRSASLGVAAWDERPAPWWLDALGVAGLVTIAFLAVTTDQYSTELFTYGILVLSLATVAVIAAAAHPRARLAGWLSFGLLRWVGERSYGIYLWHMPIIALMPAAFLSTQPWLRGSVALALTLVIAAASWTLVENPIRTHGLRAAMQRSRRTPGSAEVDAIPHGGNATSEQSAPGASEPGESAPGASALGSSDSKAAVRAPHPRVTAAVGSVAVVLLGATLVSCSAVVTQSTEAQAATLHTTDQSATLGAAGEASDAGAPPSAHDQALPAISANPSPPAGGASELKVSRNSQPTTSCTAVMHVGDSTSLGLVKGGGLAKSDQVAAQYKRVGAAKAYTDVKGARSIVEKFKGEPNAQEAVQAKLDDGYAGCWVIAMGTNEVANQAVGGSHPLAERIDMIMAEVDGAPVLWPTVRTTKTKGPWSDSGMSAMSKALEDACTRYPNLRVYDWRSEVHKAWYLDDGIHFTSKGYTERGHRLADALAEAFPADGAPADSCFVKSG